VERGREELSRRKPAVYILVCVDAQNDPMAGFSPWSDQVEEIFREYDGWWAKISFTLIIKGVLILNCMKGLWRQRAVRKI
jgi:hypothetical protein